PTCLQRCKQLNETRIVVSFHRRFIMQRLLCFVLFVLTLTVSTAQAQPNSAIAYFNRGNDKVAKKDFPGAVEDYSAAIAFDPNFAAAYLSRGNTEFEQGNIGAAMTDYNRTITLNPRLAEAYVGRSAARFLQGDVDGALADSNQAI